MGGMFQRNSFRVLDSLSENPSSVSASPISVNKLSTIPQASFVVPSPNLNLNLGNTFDFSSSSALFCGSSLLSPQAHLLLLLVPIKATHLRLLRLRGRSAQTQYFGQPRVEHVHRDILSLPCRIPVHKIMSSSTTR